MNKDKLKIGSRVWFYEEVKPYKVRAFNSRYIILTKPFNLKGTVFYTIIDTHKNIRSSDDRLFCSGYESDEQCADRMNEINSGIINLSRRNSIPCKITKISY